jgi:hypothetical protein
VLEQKQQHEAEAQRQRDLLLPSLDPFHEIILNWDYFDLEALVPCLITISTIIIILC